MKRATLWPAGIVLFFAGLMALYAYLYHVAGDPAALVVEPDYYQKGLHFDSTIAQEKRNEALGWSVVPELTPLPGGNARLRATLTDRAGRTLPGATVRVVAVHNLIANRPDSAKLADDGGGRYDATLAMPRAGMWELRFDVVRGADTFTADERVELPRIIAKE